MRLIKVHSRVLHTLVAIWQPKKIKQLAKSCMAMAMATHHIWCALGKQSYNQRVSATAARAVPVNHEARLQIYPAAGQLVHCATRLEISSDDQTCGQPSFPSIRTLPVCRSARKNRNVHAGATFPPSRGSRVCQGVSRKRTPMPSLRMFVSLVRVWSVCLLYRDHPENWCKNQKPMLTNTGPFTTHHPLCLTLHTSPDLTHFSVVDIVFTSGISVSTQ